MWRSGRRCDVCRAELVGSAPAVPTTTVLYGFSTRKGSSFAHDLCLACQQRNARGQAAAHADLQRAVVESKRSAEQWLRGSPVVDAPPAVVGSYAEKFPHVPFVEVMGFHTAAQHIARVSHGLEEGRSLRLPSTSSGGRMPPNYDNVLDGTAPYPDERRLHVYGSVSRLADGDVALHWHSSHLYPSFE